MPNRDQDQRRSQQSNQQSDLRQAGQRNERSDLNDQATDKNKRTQQAGSSSESNWDQTDRKSSDM